MDVYSVNRGWWDSFTSCFVGTLLGIGVTFWVSGYLEKKSNAEMEHRIQLLSLANIKNYVESSKNQMNEFQHMDSIFRGLMSYYPDSIKYIPKELVGGCYSGIFSFNYSISDNSADNMFNNNIEIWKSIDNISDINIIGQIFAGKRTMNEIASNMNEIKKRIYRNISRDNYVFDLDNHIDAINVLFSNKENLNLMLEYRVYCGTYNVSVGMLDNLLNEVMANMGITEDDLDFFGGEEYSKLDTSVVQNIELDSKAR